MEALFGGGFTSEKSLEFYGDARKGQMRSPHWKSRPPNRSPRNEKNRLFRETPGVYGRVIKLQCTARAGPASTRIQILSGQSWSGAMWEVGVIFSGETRSSPARGSVTMPITAKIVLAWWAGVGRRYNKDAASLIENSEPKISVKCSNWSQSQNNESTKRWFAF